MISAVAWMPRGCAKAVPVPYEPTEDEMEEMRREADLLEKQGPAAGDDEDEWEDMSDDSDEEDAAEKKAKAEKAAAKARAAANAAKSAGDDDLVEYNLDDYDDEPNAAYAGGLSMFQSNDEDPYITLPDHDDDSGAEDDNLIRPSDDIILSCRSEEEGHTLEVYVYDEKEGSLFVHHDLMLNAFPLCVTWLSCAKKDGSTGSFAAIGTMDTEIEVWDLDCIDSMLPAALLGGEEVDMSAGGKPKSKGKKKSKKAQKVFKEGSHRDAVLGLSWHKQQKHILASASADKTVKIWDVPQEKCMHTLSHHTDKVQALQWHPTEASVLLTGGFDKNAAVCDVRATAADWKAAGKWPLSGDVECVAWDPHSQHRFLVSTEDGTVTCHDARHAGQGPLFTIGAHTEACTGLAVNPNVPGLLATSSLDRTVKLWDMRENKVDYIASRAMECGQVFCASWCGEHDSRFTLAAGGKDSKLHIWNTAASAAVRARFATGKTEEDFLDEETELEMAKMNLDDDAESEDDDSSDDEVQDGPEGQGFGGKPKAGRGGGFGGGGRGGFGGGGRGGGRGGGGKKTMPPKVGASKKKR